MNASGDGWSTNPIVVRSIVICGSPFLLQVGACWRIDTLCRKHDVQRANVPPEAFGRRRKDKLSPDKQQMDMVPKLSPISATPHRRQESHHSTTLHNPSEPLVKGPGCSCHFVTSFASATLPLVPSQ